MRLDRSDSRRVAWFGLAVALALAAAGGAWTLGQHRYGELLNEWRWRGRLRDVKSVQAPSPGDAGIGLALLLTQSPERATCEGGAPWSRFYSGCSASPSV